MNLIISLLKFGLSGACVALAYLGYLTLRKEQSHTGEPRTPILKVIYLYFALCLVLAILLFAAECLRLRNDQKIAYYEATLDNLHDQMHQKFIHEVQGSHSPTILETFNTISQRLEEARHKYRDFHESENP